jgi:2-desacetyl-2-hydroxyethyl bacteriochlorophyllide A dehydrogenase
MKRLMVEGPRKAAIRTFETPELGPNQVLIRTRYSAISHGTEMNVYRGLAPMYSMKHDPETRLFVKDDKPSWTYPIPYGYTLVGIIEETGEAVSRVAVGDHVFAYEAHATVAVAHEDAVLPIPSDIPIEHGVFNANLNTAFNSVLDAGITLGDAVVVFGQGVIGLFAMQMAKLAGASPVIAVDTVNKRLALASKLGADIVINAAEAEDVAYEIKKATGLRGADIAIEASGNDVALHEAIRCVAYGGKVVVVSWYGKTWEHVRPGGEFHHNRVNLIGSQVGGINPSLSSRWNFARRQEQVFKFMRTFDFDSLITNRVAFANAPQAFQLVDEHPEEVVQVLLTYEEAQ